MNRSCLPTKKPSPLKSHSILNDCYPNLRLHLSLHSSLGPFDVKFVTVLEGRVVGDWMGRLKGLVTPEEAGAMPTIGTRGGRWIPQIASYRKSKQLPRITDVQVEERNVEEGKENMRDANESEEDSKEESDEESVEGVDEGEVEGKAMWTEKREKDRDEEGEDVDSKRVLKEKNRELEREEEKSGEGESEGSEEGQEEGPESENVRGLKRDQETENQRNLLGEKKMGMEKEKKMRETMKLRKKGHLSRHVGRQLHQVVGRAVDVVQKWKALPTSESSMTLAEMMADDVLRHLTGKNSATSGGFEQGTQSGSHTFADDSGPSKRKNKNTD
ncbi:hypothetical protein Scep_017056 [Stephania cephalantha]|uniref:Uncharacterized protein n=1 Tax=Stephania cephalantha TaxID=152367 RepID=A0AAP0INU5_9MAGN